jgi:hypothetical protein
MCHAVWVSCARTLYTCVPSGNDQCSSQCRGTCTPAVEAEVIAAKLLCRALKCPLADQCVQHRALRHGAGQLIAKVTCVHPSIGVDSVSTIILYTHDISYREGVSHLLT